MRKVGIIVILFTLSIMSVYAYPIYTSNTGRYSGGTYGQTSIPIIFDDETGNQLFDGDYGGYDWLENPGGVVSVEDYWTRHEQQNGYAFGWLAWYGIAPTIVFDMGSSYTFNQVGIHGYQRLSGAISVPQWISVSFSNDGANFWGNVGQSVAGNVPEDSVIWKSFSFQPVTARYITIDFPVAFCYYLDELSINGMDGAQFATIPEPSSWIAFATGLISLGMKRRAKR